MILKNYDKQSNPYQTWLPAFAWFPVEARNEHNESCLIWLEPYEYKYELGYGGSYTIRRFTELNL